MSDKGNEYYEPREPDFARRFSNYCVAAIFAFPIFALYLAASVFVVVRVLQWTGVIR